MIRLTKVALALLITCFILLLKGSSPLVTTATAKTRANTDQKTDGPESIRDAPPDTTPYRRPAFPEGYTPGGIRAIPLTPAVFIADVVVNNTDPNLTDTDIFNDGETSLAINLANPDEIVVTSFAEGSELPGRNRNRICD